MSSNPTYHDTIALIAAEAREHGIPEQDFLRFAWLETGGTFDTQATRGPAGANGLFPFLPALAQQYGIAGRELDAAASTHAAARLYLDNRDALTAEHARSGLPYLSGSGAPDGLDLYLAHQQGARGYRDMQAALAGGELSEVRRSRLMDTISPRDCERITGTAHSDLAGLPGSDLTRTFVDYWQARYERIRVDEHGITLAPLAAAGSPDAASSVRTANPVPVRLDSPYALSAQYHDKVNYGSDVKDVASGRIDGSGWVGMLVNAGMDEINAQAGREVFTRADRLGRLETGSAAGDIVRKTSQASGMLLTGQEISATVLREGMIIGEDNGRQGWDAGRFKGIDHITMVVRHPQADTLMISQARSGEGVQLSPLDAYLEHKQAHAVMLFATDPLAKARTLLHTHEKSGPETIQALGEAEVIDARSSGQAVIDVQRMLNALGYAGPDGQSIRAVQGTYGADTAHAVRLFQQAHALPQSGAVDRATMHALHHAVERPLVSELGHPAKPLHDALQQRLPAGVPASALANITLHALENGIDSPDKLGRVGVHGSDVLVISTVPGFKARVDLQAPTPAVQTMSDDMREQLRGRDQAPGIAPQPHSPEPGR